MNVKNIRFANLNFDYSVEKVKAEFDSLPELLDLPIIDRLLDQQWRIPIFTQEQIDNTSYVCTKTGTVIPKKHLSWKGCSLTYLDNNSRSITGAGKIRNQNIFKNWKWREDINTPYIKSIVEHFDFKILHTVRMLTLPPNGIGLVHWDDINDYYSNGGFSITLNVANGNSPIVFLNKDKQYNMWPGKCHIFRDDCWHGIPQVEDTRIQLRINGVLKDTQRIQNLIDQDSIIFAD